MFKLGGGDKAEGVVMGDKAVKVRVGGTVQVGVGDEAVLKGWVGGGRVEMHKYEERAFSQGCSLSKTWAYSTYNTCLERYPFHDTGHYNSTSKSGPTMTKAWRK